MIIFGASFDTIFESTFIKTPLHNTLIRFSRLIHHFVKMFSKTAILLSLAAATFAEPIPQAAATTSSLDLASLTSQFASSYPTSIDTAGLSSGLDSETSLLGLLSGLPTLPASVASVLATAVPTSEVTRSDYACELVTATPAWYSSLPADVKSALKSYQTEVESWYSEHSSAFAAASITAPAAVCTGAGAGTGAQATGGSGSGSGSTGGSSAASGTAKATGSQGAAPRATGAIVGSVAGVMGVLGLMAAL
jgi:hypothetical protein